MGGCCIALGLKGGLKIYVVAASGFEMTVVRVDAGAGKPLGDLWVSSGFAMGGLGWCTLCGLSLIGVSSSAFSHLGPHATIPQISQLP
jgi:hypothetical protein